jgi:hypothetical protein
LVNCLVGADATATLLLWQICPGDAEVSKFCQAAPPATDTDVGLPALPLRSGCVIAGDVPTEMEEELKSFMVVLQPWWSIEVRPTRI